MTRILVPENFNRNSFFVIVLRAHASTAVLRRVDRVYTCIHTYVGINLSQTGDRRGEHSGGDSISKGMSFAKARVGLQNIYQYVRSRGAHAFHPARIRIALGPAASIAREHKRDVVPYLAKSPQFLTQIRSRHFPESALRVACETCQSVNLPISRWLVYVLRYRKREHARSYPYKTNLRKFHIYSKYSCTLLTLVYGKK